MGALYRALAGLLFPFLVLAALPVLLLWPRGRVALRDRLGLNLPTKPSGTPRLWIHAASVGEVKTAAPLVHAIRAQWPSASLLVSTMTPAGWQVAKSDFELSGLAQVRMAPADAPWPVRRYLRAFQPDALVVIETEHWPCLYSLARKAGVSILTVNGRISERGLARMRRVRPLMRTLLANVDRFEMRSEKDLAHLLEVAPGARGRASVAGNIKYDALAAQAVRRDLPAALVARFQQGRWAFFASTHPGEEKWVLEMAPRLLGAFPDLRLLIAPRAPQRFGEVAAMMEASGLPFVRQSRLEGGGMERLLLLDSVGQLFSLFQYAHLVFVGGSLIPRGGHNLLEPAWFARPVLFGPHMGNFHEERDILLGAQGGVEVRDAVHLEEAIRRWLSDPEAARAAGQRGRRAVESRTGAVNTIMAALSGLLDGRPAS